MTTSTTASLAATFAVSFFSALRRAGTPLPRFELDEALEAGLRSAPNGRGRKADEADAIRFLTGVYSVGEPHGTQLDAARHMARVILDPGIAAIEERAGMIVAELSPAERELLRRWRNYERRARLAREALRDLNAEILEMSEKGDLPSPDQCADRSALVAEVEFWQKRADNPLDFPLEVDQYSEEEEGEDLESLVSAQKADYKDWLRRSC
jgi:hypothetical protein